MSDSEEEELPRRRLSSFELSDSNLSDSELSFSEVTRRSKNSTASTANLQEDKPNKIKPQGYKKHSLRWWLGSMLHKDANINKLNTREDKDFIHKTLGTASLISFIYRYGYVYNTTGTLGFTGKYMDWVTMIIHTLLAFSSILFRVPVKRIDNKPMVIYEEYRQHAMVFTSRCLFVYACAVLYPESPKWFVPCVVCAHHMLADSITAKHGSGSTAVRAGGDKEGSKIPDFYKKIGLLYSFYQFLAVASHILPGNPALADLAYNAVIAIQSSAFMMTLYRKKIVRGRTHVVVYSACLILSAFHICRLIGATATLFVLGAFTLRVNLPRWASNKYVIWITFLVSHNYRELALPYLQPLITVLTDKAVATGMW